MRKFLSLVLAGALSVSAFSACKPQDSGTASPSTQQKTDSPSAQNDQTSDVPATKQKVLYWATYKGDEFAQLEKVVAKFNETNDKYETELLSVTDKQKFVVSMSSSDGPDLILGSTQDLISYADQGLIRPLDDLIAKDGFDMNMFTKSTIKANTIDGKFYGLPWHTTIIQMYYNKDLLAEAGYAEPPKTMDELYEIALKATKTNANGDIDVIAYPLFPLASNRFEGVYAFGGRWASDDGRPTPNTPEIQSAWNMNRAFREQFGLEKMQKYVATSNTNRYTPEDAFFAGKQLFRFDGPWLNKMISNNNPDLNYGIALIPGTNANPENRGSTRFETQNSAITIKAKNLEGAWVLAKYLTIDAQKDLVLSLGQLPASVSLLDDPDVKAVPGNELFLEALKLDNGVPFPAMKDYQQYISLIDEAYDYIYNGTKTVEKALADLQAEADRLE